MPRIHCPTGLTPLSTQEVPLVHTSYTAELISADPGDQLFPICRVVITCFTLTCPWMCDKANIIEGISPHSNPFFKCNPCHEWCFVTLGEGKVSTFQNKEGRKKRCGGIWHRDPFARERAKYRWGDTRVQMLLLFAAKCVWRWGLGVGWDSRKSRESEEVNRLSFSNTGVQSTREEVIWNI